jgi:hypothetical protein
MGLNIEDGTGRGYQVKVNAENQLETVSVNHELQHHISKDEAQVYQIVGFLSDVWNGTNTVLHIQNTSTTLHGVVSYMRLQCPGTSGSSWLPDSGTYFQIGTGTSYGSGGTTVSPVNMNFQSGNIAPATVYKDNPAVTGTFVEFDRWYPNDSMMTFNKHGSLILGLNDTMEIRFITDRPEHPTVYCRVTMMFIQLSN